MQKMKSVLLAAIIIVSVCAYTPAVFAQSNPQQSNIGISPFYINVNTCSANLSISGTTATAYVSLDGNTNAKSVSVTYSLQRKSGSSWVNVKSWTASSSTRFLNSNNSYSPLTKGTPYRLYATFTVTATNGTKEVITDYSATYTC